MQCVINPLNSAGAISYVSERFDPKAVLAACRHANVPTLAIRAVQAGALTSAMDRELPPDDADRMDFDRAAGFRALAAEWRQSPAALAHRYALSTPDISSVILGVKNRDELAECLQAEVATPLTDAEMQALEEACQR